MIVIPMGGLSSRFSAAGYDVPKFMLRIGDRTVFDHAVDSFRAYFASVPFLFIVRGGAPIVDFVAASCAALGIKSLQIEILSGPTAGQAETVEQGLKGAEVPGDTPVTIFNIDTFRPGFQFPDQPWSVSAAGYLEVFHGAGSNWSYVRAAVDAFDRVIETAEKRPISNLCCTGLYHFARAEDFLASLGLERRQPSSAELYVAPLYNHLIRQGMAIHYSLVSAAEIVFCGVPSEYEKLLSANPLRTST